jgi:short-subunit dehydrogenase
VDGERKWAVVTGASQGIGRSIAIELAKAGFNVRLVSRSREKLENVASLIKRTNPQVSTQIIPIDLQSNLSSDNFRSLFPKDQTTSILVNNAGYQSYDIFFNQDPVAIEKMLTLNMAPYALLTKYAILANRDL